MLSDSMPVRDTSIRQTGGEPAVDHFSALPYSTVPAIFSIGTPAARVALFSLRQACGWATPPPTRLLRYRARLLETQRTSTSSTSRRWPNRRLDRAACVTRAASCTRRWWSAGQRSVGKRAGDTAPFLRRRRVVISLGASREWHTTPLSGRLHPGHRLGHRGRDIKLDALALQT